MKRESLIFIILFVISFHGRGIAQLDYGYGTNDAPINTIGRQVWMLKNLNVAKFANGDSISEARSPEEWKRASEKQRPAWCYYNNDPSNADAYGKLYNWYAVNDRRGLAPTGWHIPDDKEWRALTVHCGGERIAGISLKDNYGWEGNGSGSNSCGFSGSPGGYRTNYGPFDFVGKNGIWWSSTKSRSGKVWTRLLFYSNGKVYREDRTLGCGFSVRCIKD